MQRFGLRLALGEVSQAPDHEPLRAEAADVELHRKGRPVLAQSRGLMAAHHHLALVRPQVGAKLGLGLTAKGFRNQPGKVLVDHLVRGIAEEAFGGRIIRADDEALVDRDDAIGHVVEDRADPVAAAAQFVLGPAPLDEVADLAADVGHHPEGRAVWRSSLAAEKGDDAGDLPPIRDRKGEVAMQSGAQGRRGVWRIRMARQVFQRCRPAGRPHATDQAGAAGKAQLLAGGFEAGDLLGRSIPAELRAEHVGVPVHRPGLTHGPAQRLAHPLQNLGGGLRPAGGIGEWPGHGKLHTPQPLRHTPLTDVGDERDEGHARAGA